MKYLKLFEDIDNIDFDVEDWEEEDEYDTSLIGSRKVNFNDITIGDSLYAKRNFYFKGPYSDTIYLYKNKEYKIKDIIEESGKKGSLLHKDRKTIIESELRSPIIRGKSRNELLDWQLRKYFYIK